MHETSRRLLSRFRKLSIGLIDASSIIYMHKAGYMAKLASAVDLYAPPEILAEVGHDDLRIKVIRCASCSQPQDQQLIACALEMRWPLISEDKAILMQLKREGIPYFNALMMLNFLLLTKWIDVKEHAAYFERLKHIAWYSPQVLEVGKSIYALIVTHQVGGGIPPGISKEE
jgi:hypothetical protein